jgi:hypothetical protein
MINLDEAQRKTVSAWIVEGLKLSEIQTRLNSEFGVTLTYMDVRLLVDDLKLTPKDIEPAKTAELAGGRTAPPPGQPPRPGAKSPAPERTPPAPPGKVSVSVDNIARPGTVASGNVTFSDGKAAEWYLDDMGRLGLMPRQEGYRPSQQDVMAFQTELQAQLERLGL